jgi:hypothetical protein
MRFAVFAVEGSIASRSFDRAGRVIGGEQCEAQRAIERERRLP